MNFFIDWFPTVHNDIIFFSFFLLFRWICRWYKITIAVTTQTPLDLKRLKSHVELLGPFSWVTKAKKKKKISFFRMITSVAWHTVALFYFFLFFISLVLAHVQFFFFSPKLTFEITRVSIPKPLMLLGKETPNYDSNQLPLEFNQSCECYFIQFYFLLFHYNVYNRLYIIKIIIDKLYSVE